MSDHEAARGAQVTALKQQIEQHVQTIKRVLVEGPQKPRTARLRAITQESVVCTEQIARLMGHPYAARVLTDLYHQLTPVLNAVSSEDDLSAGSSGPREASDEQQGEAR